jgi:hypothetical protein
VRKSPRLEGGANDERNDPLICGESGSATTGGLSHTSCTKSSVLVLVLALERSGRGVEHVDVDGTPRRFDNDLVVEERMRTARRRSP